MLRLEKLELTGFKSFSDKTEVSLPEGITAVVGPNGCGKSNIGDAINWVLGEQSPKMLRGKLMADVIFSGSEGRKPTGMAEVSLHLSGIGGERDSRAIITRRLFRNGESDYELDGKRVRLKDIQEILREERVGAKTYATIEQGRIDQILNAKPKERRLIIEEAAGVAGFKHKRRLTELKLEATEANLLRVTDIITEVRRQINSIKRQAAKARRYQRIRERLREQQRLRFAHRARGMDAELQAQRRLENDAKAREAERAAELASLEAGIGRQRDDLDEADRRFRAEAERLHGLDIEIDRQERQVQLCKERIAESAESEQKLDREATVLNERCGVLGERARAHEEGLAGAEAELRDLAERLEAKKQALVDVESRIRHLRERIESTRGDLFGAMNRSTEQRNLERTLVHGIARAKERIAKLVDERSSTEQDSLRLADEASRLDVEIERQKEEGERLAGECETLDRKLTDAREAHDASVRELAAAREAEQSLDARLRTLEDVATRFAGVSDGVRMLLTKGRESGIRTGGVVADFVEVSRDAEAAAESYLEALLPTVILEEDDDACRTADLLKRERAGKTTFLCRSQPTGKVAIGSGGNGAPLLPAELAADSRVFGRLREHLRLDARTNGVIAERIGDALIVDNLSTALEFHRKHPSVDYLTRSGEVVYASGVVLAGGRQAGDGGLLAHSRRIQDVRQELEAAVTRVADGRRLERDRMEALESLTGRLAERREQLEQIHRRRVEIDLRAERSAEDRARAERQRGVLEDELRALEDEATELVASLDECRRLAGSAESEQALFEEQLGSRNAELAQLDEAARGLGEQVAGLRAEFAAREQRHQAAQAEARQIAELLQESRERLEGMRAEADRARTRAADSRTLLAQTETQLTANDGQRRECEARVRALENDIADKRRALQEGEQSLQGKRRHLDEVRETARAAELARARLESDREHLDALCLEELGFDCGEAIARAGEEALAGVVLEELEERIAELRGQLDKMGPVNILAIDEFSDLEERHEFLSAQKLDLEKSIQSLRETIRRINRRSRERFLEAFEAIRKNYQEIYRVLFNGGRADLRLEEGEDVLECGIDILSQPPGKRLGSVQLLSGGEKAMSAIALLFAIFRYRPSPFCLLDEVDAPLDDANVGRFTRMLREYAAQTQFILITHNKLSMEAADLLYGVTMEEAGVSRLVSMQLQ